MDMVSPSASDSNNPPETTFIYALLDPRTNDIRYVGKADNPKNRLQNHWCARHQKKTPKNSWLISLAEKGLYPNLRILEEVPVAIWQERERYWIAYYRASSTRLTNVMDGGEGAKKTPEQRAAQSALYKQLGIRPPVKVLEMMRERLKGKPVDPEVLAKKRATLQAKREAGIRRKPVVTSDTLKSKRKAYMLDYWQRQHAQDQRTVLAPAQAAIAKFNIYGLYQKEYASMFGVTQSLISAIQRGILYKHITRDHLPPSPERPTLWDLIPTDRHPNAHVEDKGSA